MDNVNESAKIAELRHLLQGTQDKAKDATVGLLSILHTSSGHPMLLAAIKRCELIKQFLEKAKEMSEDIMEYEKK